ncbi:response regulator [Sphingomonas sp. BIUV-7]|uniref:Response regulator n=1 Tax=Sphingomonas natans TaxID=3063330 RepID=A0ABT8Y720_9SPHN|nr:response regulator [Sphingomonas sp. BIUV-7]MDO6414096.1 response regulator [Sphingomonas sp. BIUV-7]
MSQNACHPTVLVVEDEVFIRMVSVDALSDAGYEVLEAENADEALALLKGAGNIDVLFTDIRMPGEMDGLELAERVHVCWPKIKLLVTSGHRRLSDDEIPDAGRFIGKPYSLDAVVQNIQGMFED